MKIWLPPLDTIFELQEDVVFDHLTMSSYTNDEFFRNLGIVTSLREWPPYVGQALTDKDREDYWEFVAASVASVGGVKLVKGTILVIDRYHHSHSGDDEATLRILASPDERINPKKNGGKGKGKGRIYLKLSQMNMLGDVELVEP